MSWGKLKNILSECRQNKSIAWKSIIKTIEAYRMTQQLEKTWAEKVLSADELKQWASFQRELASRTDEKESFEKNWRELVSQVDANLKNDPSSEIAITLAKRCMDMVNSLYGDKYKQLQRVVWEKGFQGGHIGAEHGLSNEAVAWLDKAVSAYYGDRITKVVMQIGNQSDDVMMQLWEALLNEMCGRSSEARAEFTQCVINYPRCTQKTKDWLMKLKTR